MVMMKLVALSLSSVLLVVEHVAGHGAMVHPRSRNSVDTYATNIPAAKRQAWQGQCSYVPAAHCHTLHVTDRIPTHPHACAAPPVFFSSTLPKRHTPARMGPTTCTPPR